MIRIQALALLALLAACSAPGTGREPDRASARTLATIPLEHASVGDAAWRLTAALPDVEASRFTTDPEANALVIYGTPAEIEQLRALVAQIDVQ